MIRTNHHDWIGHVLEAYDRLLEHQYDKIIVVGHSMGGLPALKLAMERHLDGIVSLATPIYLRSRKPMLAPVAQYFIKYVNKKTDLDQDLLEEICSYRKAPIPCIVSSSKLLKMVKEGLFKVRSPLFIAQGQLDGVVQPKSAAYLYNHVASEVRELSLFPEFNHGMLLDKEWERLYGQINSFVNKLMLIPSSAAATENRM